MCWYCVVCVMWVLSCFGGLDHVTGFFLKIDQFGKIQSDTVHLGREPVTLAKILKAYNGLSVSREYM